MKILIVKPRQKVSMDQLRDLGAEFYQELVVGAVDLRREIVAFGGQYNNDARTELVDKRGSAMGDIWGFKILLTKSDRNDPENIALTDIRPGEGNPDTVTSAIKRVVRQIVESKIECIKN